jgi:geranylgeranyl diphosphate synthase, type II
MKDLKDEIARLKSKVDSVILDGILPKASQIPEVDLLYRMMRDYPSRPAKGLRPFLCVTTCRAMGGTEDEALHTAAALEMFQHWILIHDDIEDGSDLRRGRPALQKEYGVGLALNAGDALHARMWETLLSGADALGHPKALRVMKEFSRMVNETTEGQHMELSWVRDSRWDLKESDYYQMCTKKTSWYTVASPCRLGGIIAGATEEELGLLLEFGKKLGVGFQMQDDALNLVGDAERYGKEPFDDLLEGKRTAILLRALEMSPRAERERAVSIMNKPRHEKTGADVEYVLGVMKSTGAIGHVQAEAKRLVDESLGILGSIMWRGEKEAVDTLKTVSRFLVERQW